MDEIESGLFLGDLTSAESLENVRIKGITHILGIINCQPDYPKSVRTLLIRVEDMPSTDLLTKWDRTFEFIEEARNEKDGKVLVHCLAGVSRSSSTVVAYLMRKNCWTVEKALDHVKRKRPHSYPNYGFREQLTLYQEMGCRLDKNNKDFLCYVFKNLPSKPYGNKTKNSDEASVADFIPDDPEKVRLRDTENALYRCRICRRMLFTGDVVLRHSKHPNSAMSEPCDKDLFQILPLKWMSYQEIKGKLMCPKCSSKLGHYDWCGKQCPCGTYVTPWFQIPESKVDRSFLDPESTTQSSENGEF